MASLIPMAGVHAGADETVADIRAGGQGGLHVGAVEGVDIHGVVRALPI